MKRENFELVYFSVYYTLQARAVHVLQQWALDLIALGPFAGWADPEDIKEAMRDAFSNPVTDAGKLVQRIVHGIGPTQALETAGMLDGSNDPTRSLEPLYARSEIDIQAVMTSGSAWDLLSYARGLDDRRAIEIVYEVFISTDFDPDAIPRVQADALEILEAYRANPEGGVFQNDLDFAVNEAMDVIDSDRIMYTTRGRLLALIAEYFG